VGEHPDPTSKYTLFLIKKNIIIPVNLGSPEEGESEDCLLQLIFISLCYCSIFQQLVFGYPVPAASSCNLGLQRLAS